MKEWLKFWSDMLFPVRCCLCGTVIVPGEHFCRDCRETAPFVQPPICPLCGRGTEECDCGKRRTAFERCVMPFYYRGEAHTGIGQLKNTAERTTVNGFAQEMAAVVRREYGDIAFDFVASVPPYRSRLFWQNPDDSSAYLAKALAKELGLPYRPVLKKLFKTHTQKGLSAVERTGNLLGAFAADPVPAGATVLLVDDVLTTGSTLHECAKMLKLAGSGAVYAVTAACAVSKKGCENETERV